MGLYSNDRFYQDRLGTNRERTPKKHAVSLQGVPESLAMEQAKRVVAAVGANPKPWWTGPEDSKGMFLQVCDCLSRACLGQTNQCFT